MKKLKYPTNQENHSYMKMRKNQNLKKCKFNKNENWFNEKLKSLNIKYSRQSTWGYRVFDFWISELGIAIEIDGPEHNEKYDNYRDQYNYKRSGIIVLRVKNLNEIEAEAAIHKIINSETWIERREKMGLLTKSQIKNKKKKH